MVQKSHLQSVEVVSDSPSVTEGCILATFIRNSHIFNYAGSKVVQMAVNKRSKNVYEAIKKSIEDYMDARRDYELYRDIDKLREMIKAYYNIIAKVGGRSA